MHLRRLILPGILLLFTPPLAWAAPQGKVIIAQGVDPSTLDPMNHQETPVSNVAVNIFDTLLERDQELNIVPLLAESYRIVAPTTWEFKLRKGIKFHNGEPFDAEAVKFSLERLVDPNLKMRGASPFAPLSRVEIMDSHTVRIHTKAPWPILDTLMSGGQAAMLPPTMPKQPIRPWSGSTMFIEPARPPLTPVERPSSSASSASGSVPRARRWP